MNNESRFHSFLLSADACVDLGDMKCVCRAQRHQTDHFVKLGLNSEMAVLGKLNW